MVRNHTNNSIIIPMQGGLSVNTEISKDLKRSNYLFSETSAAYHELYRQFGMPDSAVSILYVLLENEGSCLLQKICRDTGLSKQTVNSALRKLEQDGTIYLNMADSKHKLVHLTESGFVLAERTAGRVIQIENEIFASWPAETVKQYLDLAEAYLMALKEKSKNEHYQKTYDTTI